MQAQNIKNFKSQRWQTLLAFNSQRRLLLTGTPLQNNLMELWSLMHFLMPSVFSSHSDFKEWFSNPLTGMVEGSQEYNDSIVKRLHQVCVLESIMLLLACLVGASQCKPHSYQSYEKISLYVCVCKDTSSTCSLARKIDYLTILQCLL